MKKTVFLILVVVCSVNFMGCATLVSSSSFNSLQQRVQNLENKVIALEESDQDTAVMKTKDGASTASSADLQAKASVMTKKDIQQALKNAGYYAGDVDGKVGSKTTSAIKEFQSDNNLKVDGVAGANTKRKLAEYL